ncbi:hypothetical protein [Gilvimarinus agarilyticus]|uniref:hypothetical protein n=1 Tax=Gilvimarinus agarilyticus TaxID=679259 RepID=UPI0005A1D817|nr:hypothetical protein [Gilvimarinus agarilyticus]
MHYSKPMIDIVMEVRRRLPSDLKPSVKLANPELLSELAQHYPVSRDTITRTLIKELMQLAGESWPERLSTPAKTDSPKTQTKVYRGQVSLEQRSEKPTAPEPETKRPLRVYRGQVVYS